MLSNIVSNFDSTFAATGVVKHETPHRLRCLNMQFLELQLLFLFSSYCTISPKLERNKPAIFNITDEPRGGQL